MGFLQFWMEHRMELYNTNSSGHTLYQDSLFINQKGLFYPDMKRINKDTRPPVGEVRYNSMTNIKSKDLETLKEDIPFPENWKRESLESMKNSICDWIDHNVKHEYITNPDIYSEEDETRLYFKIHEKGGSDKENDGDDYYCVFEKYDTRKVEDTDVEFQ